MLIDDINRNRELADKLKSQPKYDIAVLGNIMVNQVKDLIELSLRENNINADLQFGDYDNIVQDSEKFSDKKAVIIFWETCNLISGLPHKSLTMDKDFIEDIINKIKSEISLVLKNLEHVPLVLFNKFSTLIFNYHYQESNAFDYICDALNEYVDTHKTKNCHAIAIDKIIANGGIQNVFNHRLWQSTKVLYTYDYLKQYASMVAPFMLSVSGKSKKVIVLDCDNTLWKGIIGEDGLEGIALNQTKKDGEYFQEVHYLLKGIMQKGVMLALNSKNNIEDVKQVFDHYPEMPLQWDDFLVTKVNWQDKVSNLKEIASELNIGLDSIVHIDDSNFEVNHIRTELDMVQVIQVPEKVKDYPTLIRKCTNLFLTLNITNEDRNRIEMYKKEKIRNEEQNKFNNIEEYLKSLNLELDIFLNKESLVERMAQMTQKTNQFNLTTKRYTDAEISNMIDSDKFLLFCFGVKDKFGDYGTTGMCIIENNNESWSINSLLLSCRILGRNIELAFISFVIDYLKKLNIKHLNAVYLKTLKNAQVAELYDKLGFTPSETNNENEKKYTLNLEDFNFFENTYIKINYEG